MRTATRVIANTHINRIPEGLWILTLKRVVRISNATYFVLFDYKLHYINNTGKLRINVTLRRVPVTIVAVQKQDVLNILSVCL
jgi:hypothetical protein